MENNVKKQFDQAAPTYDDKHGKLIPCYQDFYGAAVTWTEVAGDSPLILDLGAGTGRLSAMMLNKYPGAQVTLVDFSEDMLEKAKARFADNDNLTYIAADYLTYEFGRTYDAVVSSLSIHHLTHEDKQVLFRKIHSLLKPGGVFVNADQAAGSSPAFVAEFKRLWVESVTATDLDPEDIEASKKRRLLDIDATLTDQLQWLRDAGFAEVDCVYRNREFTVFVARI
ncbi:class I SAM-dependent methyltransferase [Paenibacillus paeoniae]|uniref:Class I SAM-dependent methyltransferase n=1 Tax=Paenibacillus paeoniae TaxID=2292705 RepID=A0A371PG43_9BACL|nr:class I SAM-dependent methyltransferase [Paenibacillus paeoniae]REK74933.1 class I SAM-dependent methyltransferase [Paenibacillus paeoniae]